MVKQPALATPRCHPIRFKPRWSPQGLPYRGQSFPPHRTAQHRTAPHRTAPHRTAPHRTAPHRTAPHRTAPHRTWAESSEGSAPEIPSALGHTECGEQHLRLTFYMLHTCLNPHGLFPVVFQTQQANTHPTSSELFTPGVSPENNANQPG
jgi:hypothetical protein